MQSRRDDAGTTEATVRAIMRHMRENTRDVGRKGVSGAVLPRRHLERGDHDRYRSKLIARVPEEHARSLRGEREPDFVTLLSEEGSSPCAGLRCLEGKGRTRDLPVFVPTLTDFRAGLARIAPAYDRFFCEPMPPGVAATGGAVAAAMQRAPFAQISPDADVDLCAFGPTREARLAAMAEALRRLLRLQPESRVRVTGWLITLRAPRGDGKVQIVYTRRPTAESHVLDCDMAYLCSFYDGRRLRTSWGCLWSMVTRRTQRSGNARRMPSRRFVKAQQKGFLVQRTM